MIPMLVSRRRSHGGEPHSSNEVITFFGRVRQDLFPMIQGGGISGLFGAQISVVGCRVDVPVPASLRNFHQIDLHVIEELDDAPASSF